MKEMYSGDRNGCWFGVTCGSFRSTVEVDGLVHVVNYLLISRSWYWLMWCGGGGEEGDGRVRGG